MMKGAIPPQAIYLVLGLVIIFFLLNSTSLVVPGTFVGRVTSVTFEDNPDRLVFAAGSSNFESYLRSPGDLLLVARFPAGVQMTQAECVRIGGSWTENHPLAAYDRTCNTAPAARRAVSVYDNEGNSWRYVKMEGNDIYIERSFSGDWYRSMAPAKITFDFGTSAPATAPAPTPATTPVCGNGIIEGDEQCDDGNIAAGDGCSDFCVNEIVLPWPFQPPAPEPAPVVTPEPGPMTGEVANVFVQFRDFIDGLISWFLNLFNMGGSS